MKEEIVIASNNSGKIKEVQEILKDYKIVSMKEIGVEIVVDEDQDTFEKNAIKIQIKGTVPDFFGPKYFEKPPKFYLVYTTWISTKLLKTMLKALIT